MTPGEIGRALARLDIDPDVTSTGGTVLRITFDELIDLMRELGADLGPGAAARRDMLGVEIEIPSAGIGLVDAAFRGLRLSRRQRRRLARGEVT